MNEAPKRITLKHIADRCGYSVNTVSRALRNDGSLSEETRTKIQQLAGEMGYIRNVMASSLRSGKSNIIAIIIEEIQNQHYTSLISQMDGILREKGYTVMIISSKINDNQNNSSLIDKLLSFSVDGILLFPYLTNSDLADLLEKNHIPFVLVDREILSVTADIVRSDDYSGGYMAGEELCRLGHREFAYISGPLNNSTQPERQRGFLDALNDYRIPKKNIRIIYSEKMLDEIQLNCVHPSTFLDALLPVNYTAIFSFNDQIGYYAMNCLIQQHYKIPHDISVIGFDYMRKDIPYLMPLTSLSYPKDCSIAQTAVEYLLTRIENPDLPARTTVFPVIFYESGMTTSRILAD